MIRVWTRELSVRNNSKQLVGLIAREDGVLNSTCTADHKDGSHQGLPANFVGVVCAV